MYAHACIHIDMHVHNRQIPEGACLFGMTVDLSASQIQMLLYGAGETERRLK